MPSKVGMVSCCPGASVTLSARNLSGSSTTLGNLVAAITVRAVAAGGCAVCAAAETFQAPAKRTIRIAVVERIWASKQLEDDRTASHALAGRNIASYIALSK